MPKNRPFVTVKIAQTFDGKIAARGGKSRWITGPESRRFVHNLRSQHDAVLVGKSTFELDRPRLSSLKPGKPKWKIVLTSPSLLPISNSVRIFDSSAVTVFVIKQSEFGLWRKQGNLRSKNCILMAVKKTRRGFDLNDLMRQLHGLGIKKLMVEGGGEVFASFLNARLADKIYWMMVPKIIGGRDAKTGVEGDGVLDPNKAAELKIEKMTKLGRDYCFEAKLI